MKDVLRFTQDMVAASEEVTRLGGRIIHQFSPTVFVAELPDETDLMTLASSTELPSQPLDANSQLAVTAWTTAKAAKQARYDAASSATEGLSWDTPGYEPPREFGTPVAAARAAVDTEIVGESTGTPTSLHLNGSVAVGVVLVSRDTGVEVLTDAERTLIVQEVQEGLDWLARVEPRARVSFVYDIRPITVSSTPGPYDGVEEPYERFERDWRDAALAAMGYGAGRTGYQQYANDLRSNRHTDWAYVAFFTKYPLNHFAYAIFEKVVMNYANDGWGPDNINRVFAHETCHIFGAADEYGSCECGGTSGHLAVPNNNCVNCFPPGAQTPCLMNANTLEMCDFSRGQIGWDERLFPKGGWNVGGWFQIHPETVFDHTTQQITAFSRTPNNIDLFVIGFDNAVWSTFWTGEGGWNPGGWFQIHPETVFDHATQQITAFSRTPNNIDLFVIGFDNAVWSTFWTGEGGWNPGGWFQIHPETVFDHTTQQITAFSRTPNNIDLFVIGFDNAVWSTFWTGEGGWNPGGWFQIHPETVFDHTTQQITAFSRTPNNIDLFVIGFDNAVWSTFWTGEGGWNPGGWFQIHPETVFDHTTQQITAFSRTPNNIDLFVIGFDNAVWSTFWTGEGGWNPGGWFQIHPETVFDHTTQQITAFSRTPNNIDLFVIGFDNAVWSTFWTGEGGWNPGGWFQIHPETVFDHTTQQITAFSRTPNNIDLFVIGFDNAVWSTFWTGA